MKRSIAFALCTFMLAGAAQAAGHRTEWGYAGPHGAEHWGDLEESFAACKKGQFQSPIDIVTTTRVTHDTIGFDYRPTSAKVVNNGHTIKVVPAKGGSVHLPDGEFDLLQFHFHSPSEVTFDGRAYPLTAHFVHRNAAGQLAVVAVLFRQGANNPILAPVFSALPHDRGDRNKIERLNVSELLPVSRNYYAFDGSLTTPPCTEGVKWYVLREPVEASAGQIAAFREIYPMNARPTQPLHGRAVTGSE
ncbi:carbonic anhydrase [Cupriavidus agavae]|uniref:carbonic anhydrase n=1 Tax=Cupriavidus agavae TaxID=1001822 RepID=A0A4V2FHR6_9BURK|nr:carbonic anhydrase family protein [Cupriavidus agavae]RZT41209.1 carbonic anhydrase [Cupriavidus agavae]